MSVNTDDTEISMTPTDIKLLIFRWANDHLSDVIWESKRRNMTATDFIILMLDDALDAYRNSEVPVD